MSRLLLAGLVFAGLTFGSAIQAWALDYEEPVVPSQFLIVPAAPAAPAEAGSLTLLRREAGGSPRATAAAVPSAPLPTSLAAYGSWSCEDVGGRALWSYNDC